MINRLHEYGRILSSATNRLIVGLVLTGLGVGLIVSAYIMV